MLTEKQVSLFWSKTAAGPKGCIVWTGNKSHNGYGIQKFATVNYRAHRVAYELGYGRPVPQGLQVDHLCSRRDCVNYLHLEAVTAYENMRRAHKWDPTQCLKGHSFEMPNARVISGGKRYCRVCRQETWRRAYQRRRAKS